MSNTLGNKSGIRRHAGEDSGRMRQERYSAPSPAPAGRGELLASTAVFQDAAVRQLPGTSGNGTIDAGDGDPATLDEASEIVGGQGNDRLLGGSGDDTYVVAAGDGNDTVADAGGQDTILFTDLNLADVTIRRSGANLLVHHGANWLTVAGHFTDAPVERIVFADGAIVEKEAAVAGVERGTANDDHLMDWVDVDAPMLVQGLEGDDSLATDTGAGRDTLDGGAGNDVLYSRASADVLLMGGDGDDSFRPLWDEEMDGSVTFDGGKGNDTFNGGAGLDIYLYRRGDGNDVIDSWYTDQVDRLLLGPGILQEHVTFVRRNQELVMTIADPQDAAAQDSITFICWFDESADGVGKRIASFEFADGSTIAGAALTESTSRRIGTAAADSLRGYRDTLLVDGAGGDDTVSSVYGGTILGGTGNDSVAYRSDAAPLVDAGSGNDSIEGYGEGADQQTIVIGGTGNDWIRGSLGGETYLYARGDGNDTIAIQYGWGIAPDRIVFGAGIDPAHVSVKRTDHDLLLTIADPADPARRESITLDFWHQANWLNEVVFADGTTWNTAHLKSLAAHILGTEGNDSIESYTGTLTIDAGGGNDSIDGLAGAGRLMCGGAGDDFVTFVARSDTIDGGAGNDVLYASSVLPASGNTHVAGGTGDDRMVINGGATTYLFNRGDGRDTILDNGATALADRVVFGAGITQNDVIVSRREFDLIVALADPSNPAIASGDQFTVTSGIYTSTDFQLERFEFADGSVLTMAQIAGMQPGGAGADNVTFTADRYAAFGRGGNDKQTAEAQSALLDGGDGDDTLTGGAAADFLYGGKGNDFLNTKGGADVIAYGSGGGADTVVSTGSNATLSLSAATGLAGLTMAKSASNLLLSFGGGDSIALRDWYASEAAKGIGRLQLHDSGGVGIYDFKALVSAFDSARAADSTLSSWAVSTHLAAAFLESSASAAYGGALAADYATQGRPEMLSAIQPTVRSQLFGVDKQAV